MANIVEQIVRITTDGEETRAEVIGKSDFSAYQSPIELIADKVRMEQDDYVVRCVQKMGVKVDRDELIRALKYDRDQYEKGYSDGRWARDSEIVRCKNCKWFNDYEVECSLSTGLVYASSNDYCSKGERKETNENV